MLGARVAGQAIAARYLADSRVALRHAARPASRMSRHPRWTAEAGAGGTAAAMPAQNGGAVDVAWLVRRAAEGDGWAWERLVDQYARLIWAMTRDFRLAESDAADVAQVTWLRLLEHIDRLEHPARLGSWLAATARHECLRAVAARKKIVLVHDDAALTDTATHQPEADERLLADERAQAVRKAVSRLPWQWQRLLQLLMADPPASYAEISDQLGLPVGSIGPTRGRCLEKLRVLLQAS
jgi:RNA polymerase sigma factor (sigma-70 family)